MAVERDNNHTPNGVWACSPTTQQRACPHPHTTHKHSIHEHPEQHVSAEVSQCSTHEHPTHPPWMSGLTTTHPTTNHTKCDSQFFGVCLYVLLLRKEVIQPHLPVRLPCYDLVPITGPTFDGSPHKG